MVNLHEQFYPLMGIPMIGVFSLWNGDTRAFFLSLYGAPVL